MTTQGRKNMGTVLIVAGVIVAIIAIILFYECSTSYEAVNLIKERYSLSQYFGTQLEDGLRASILLQEAKNYLIGGIVTLIISLISIIVGATMRSKAKKETPEREQ